MKIVLVAYGSRGDVEPVVAVGRELLRRGHDVRIGVPPDRLGLVEAAGLAGVAYGPDSQEELAAAAEMAANPSANIRNPVAMLTAISERVSRVKADKTATLKSLTEGADLLVAGFNEQGLAANVAEYQGIPLAVVHVFPAKLWLSEGPGAALAAETDAVQRRALGLPEQPASAAALEIQAYDELYLPGPAANWVATDGPPRPFVGALTLELPTTDDDEVLAWIAAGEPPIYFGFGSTPLPSAAETLTVLAGVAEELGERALICSGANDMSGVLESADVKIVPAVNHSAVLPACRAAVHHGGAGVTAAGLRAGIPTMILWSYLDQPVWADAVTRLRVGIGRGFFESTFDSLFADLRDVLDPQCLGRARDLARRLTPSAESATRAADLLEELVRGGGPG